MFRCSMNHCYVAHAYSYHTNANPSAEKSIFHMSFSRPQEDKSQKLSNENQTGWNPTEVSVMRCVLITNKSLPEQEYYCLLLISL